MISDAKIARMKKGFRQIDLAMQVDVSPSQISYFENGILCPSPELARKLNSILGKAIYPEDSAECQGKGK